MTIVKPVAGLPCPNQDLAIWFGRVRYAVSKSRLGGVPSLPADIGWPVNPRTKLPLHFLGQVDLSSVPTTPLFDAPNAPILPRIGMLFFFMALGQNEAAPVRLKATAKANSKVVYTRASGPDRAVPDDLPLIVTLDIDGRPATTFPAASVQAHAVPIDQNQPPDVLLEAIERATGIPAPRLDSDALDQAIRTWPVTVPSYFVYASANPYVSIAMLQMFGVPSCFNSEGELAQSEGRHLLMQFDDRIFGETMSMDSLTQFWIMPEDLRACRFDEAWATMEA
jgi:Domain of unknown function (DUF1963)